MAQPQKEPGGQTPWPSRKKSQGTCPLGSL
ncbi:hypothetical protein N288_04575 [Bacillus infantis NRRL B-14911]|uniref:Uncharacterized protein n=1 Tax=Bacillus infantis NRRL B-14911 TaxID=1367477 RepID=U5L8B7_9BACI|nr:hypothetical protein N288_04575 [Bacillus infantis NRRL B-14911]